MIVYLGVVGNKACEGYMKSSFLKFGKKVKLPRHYYNVTLKRVRITIVVVEKQ